MGAGMTKHFHLTPSGHFSQAKAVNRCPECDGVLLGRGVHYVDGRQWAIMECDNCDRRYERPVKVVKR